MEDIKKPLAGRFIRSEKDGLILWKDDQYRLLAGTHFYFNSQKVEPQSLQKFLDEGDLIVVQGTEINLLLKSQRSWNPSQVRKETLKNWTKFHHEVRAFFIEKDFLEILTPTLVKCPGSEPTLDPYEIKDSDFYLPTSPEWHLKKALVMGFENIFEIKSCFRKNEFTEKHRPEFLMLEWYRSYTDLQQIQKDVIDLIAYCCQKFQVQDPKEIETWTIKDLFKKELNFNLTPETSEAELRELAQVHKIDIQSATTIDDVFFLIFGEKIESNFNPNHLIFVKDYPPYQAALAKLTPEGWGERFEAYWKGFELCNAFNELNDPKIQRERFAEDQSKKVSLGKPTVGTDEEFFEALERGMPPSSGIALGLERLFLALFNQKNFKSLRLF